MTMRWPRSASCHAASEPASPPPTTLINAPYPFRSVNSALYGDSLGLNSGSIPLIRALDATAILAARLVRLHLSADVAALRADFSNRLVPDNEIARRIIRASVESLAAFLRTTNRNVASIFRTLHASRHR